MWRTECASGWSNRDREVALVVTGFVTDVEEGFKTHGRFAARRKPSLCPDWLDNVHMSGSLCLICSFLLFYSHPPRMICWFADIWVLLFVLLGSRMDLSLQIGPEQIIAGQVSTSQSSICYCSHSAHAVKGYADGCIFVRCGEKKLSWPSSREPEQSRIPVW